MDYRLSRLDSLYDEIHAFYREHDPDLVRRRTMPEALESRVLLLGQALGRDTQRLSGLPYCFPPGEHPTLSRGGKVLDAFLARFGYTIRPGGSARYAYHTDLVHYFPGRNESRTGDMKPPAKDIAHDRHWLEIEIGLIKPMVVVALGKQPAKVFLGRYSGLPVNRLRDLAGRSRPCCVGEIKLLLIPVYHPSGSFQHVEADGAYRTAARRLAHILAS